MLEARASTWLGWLLILIVSGSALAQSPPSSPRQVAAGLSGDRTDVQRQAFWETVKGQAVRWTIQVTEVTPGWLSGFYVRGEAAPSLGVSCELDDSPANKVAANKINIGDRVVCSGKLGDPWMVLFGHAVVSIKNASVVPQPRSQERGSAGCVRSKTGCAVALTPSRNAATPGRRQPPATHAARQAR